MKISEAHHAEGAGCSQAPDFGRPAEVRGKPGGGRIAADGHLRGSPEHQ
ncbi:MAG: hypothetical protein IPG61_02890 [bacterium]|nr:hypothetical protein [bacterium]